MSILTPTLRNKSPTIFRADIRADGVSGVPPFSVGIPARQKTQTYRQARGCHIHISTNDR